MKAIHPVMIAGMFLGLFPGKGESQPPQTAETPPNIIFILADDLGYGDIGALNPESRIPTPNIDKLAEEGMMFTNAHAPAAVCTPSRYSFLTGRYSWRSDMKMGVSWIWDPPLIHEDRLTIGDMLQSQGYVTACIGKWHLGWDWPTTDGQPATLKSQGLNVDYSMSLGNGPVTRGFNYYFGDDVPSFPPHAFIQNDRLVIQPTEWLDPGKAGAPGAMIPGWTYENLLPSITEKAISFIITQTENDRQKPFFLYFAVNAPHTPIAPSAPFKGKTAAGPYGDFVYELDWYTGQIIKTVDDLGISGNTLIIFTSDNGPTNQDGKNYVGKVGSLPEEYGHNSASNLRGIKSDAWEGGHREPFIVRWPGRIKPGSVSSQLLSLADMMATFAALNEFTIPQNAGEDSYNMLPVFLGKAESPVRPAMVTQSGNGILAIQEGDWKLIMSSGSGGSWTKPKGELPFFNASEQQWQNVQLFNTTEDISEQHDLAAEHPGKVREMVHLLTKYIKDGRSTPGEPQLNNDPQLWPQVEWSRYKEVKGAR